MTTRYVLIEIHANGRHCARDCPHLRTFAEDSVRCSLFASELTFAPRPPDQQGLRKILRAKPCRKAEYELP